MIVALLFFAGSAQPVPAPPAPPPIISVPVAPSPLAVARVAPPIIRSEPAPAVPIDVRITAGDNLLFSDTLRVARNAGASYSQSRSEASPVLCPGFSGYDRGERSSLNIQLYWRESGGDGPGVSASVNWQRPQGGTDCAEIGSRGVQVSQSVRLAPGESAVIRGDAGLVVRLTRR